jgi:hypothetical protein
MRKETLDREMEAAFKQNLGNPKDEYFSGPWREMRSPSLNRALLQTLKGYVRETGVGHSEFARELGINPGALLGWMRGTTELPTETLVAIKCVLDTGVPARQRAMLVDQQTGRKIKWHPFLQYPR